MARLPKINYELVDKAREIVSSCSDINELKNAQAVLLPATMGATLEQTALILGVSRASVQRLQKRFRLDRNTGGSPKQKWGGRRRELMTAEEEKEFLLPWEEKAETGGILVASVIRAALVRHLGRPVRPSVVYRLLERHNWRKVSPDTRHPKSDPKIREEWKKNFRRKRLP